MVWKMLLFFFTVLFEKMSERRYMQYFTEVEFVTVEALPSDPNNWLLATTVANCVGVSGGFL